MLKKYIFATSLLVLLLVIFEFAAVVVDPPGRVLGQKIVRRPARPVYTHYSVLTGQGLTARQSEGMVVAAMIDNHPDALLGQSGLFDAKIVYEVPVEGVFTRFMALYTSDQRVAKVGPIRSARPYFLDWVEEYNKPLYMHSGGSPEALRQLKSQERALLNADEFYKGAYYWRDESLYAPHNLFTSSSLWQTLVKKLGATKTPVAGQSWKFSSNISKLAAPRPAQAVTLPYAANYSISWKFDPKRQDYVRYVNGVQHLDSGKEIRAANVLVQYVNDKVLDDEGRLFIYTQGTGSARMLKKGYILEGSWEKYKATSRTKFLTKDKKEHFLVPGKTWVEVMPRDVAVQITN